MTGVFVAVLALSVATRLFLAARQVRCVRAHREAVPEAFADRVPLDAHQKAADYTVARVRAGVVDLLVGAALLLAWTLGGGIDLLAAGFATDTVLGGTLFLLAAAAIAVILTLPLDLYRTFVLEEQFGFNRTTPKLFVVDLVKGALLLALLGGPVALGALALLAHGGTLWWVWLGAGWIAFSLFLMWAWPAFLAPLFYRFDPLPEGELRRAIEGLLQRTGYRADTISIMDGSRRSAHSNAFFAGFGKRKRVVLFDTLCEQMPVDELEAVLAHEIGHDRHGHILRRFLFGAVQTFLVLALFAWLRGQAWFQGSLGVHEPSDGSALLLLLWVGPVFAFPLRPLMSWWSRTQEYEADRFAARESSGKALARALVRLYETNASTLTPDPLYSAYFDSHPPASLRIGRLEASLKFSGSCPNRERKG